MTAPYNRRFDVFTDWLDAQVTGMSTPDHELAADADLADLCAAADQFHGLAERLGQNAARVSPSARSWEDIMATNPAMLLPDSPASTGRATASTRWDRHSMRSRFDRFTTGALAAALVVAIGGGAWLAADRTLPGGGNEPPATTGFAGLGPEGGDTSHFVPIATVGPNQESSSIPFPTSEECTVEPLTRDEVIVQLTAANMATEEEYDRYERAIEPSNEDAAAIMQTYRMWQACQLNDRAYAYAMQLETPWFTATTGPLFLINGRPVSNEMIEEFADIAIEDGGDAILWPPVYGSPPADGPEGMESATPDLVPIPDGATPIVFPSNSEGNAPTIFAEDIVITGPNTARATVYFVNPETLEVSMHSPNIWYEFVKVEGQWLLNAYQESQVVG